MSSHRCRPTARLATQRDVLRADGDLDGRDVARTNGAGDGIDEPLDAREDRREHCGGQADDGARSIEHAEAVLCADRNGVADQKCAPRGA